MSRNLSPETLDAIAALGFDVYQSINPNWHSYCYFTDGTRVGYLENRSGWGLALTTVNIPCRECGTGFGMSEMNDPPFTLTREYLERAFVVAPHWASSRDAGAVKKYRDMAHFLSEPRNRDLICIRKGMNNER